MESAQPVLTVKSVYDAVDWYERVLGFSAVYLNEEPNEPDSLNYAVLSRGRVGVHLGREGDMGVIAGNGGANFVTRDYDALLAAARDSGAQFHVEPGEIPTGARTFGIRDPDGNLLTFVEADVGADA